MDKMHRGTGVKGHLEREQREKKDFSIGQSHLGNAWRIDD